MFVIGDSISIDYGPWLHRALRPTFDYARKSGEEEALKNLDIPRGTNGGDSAMVLEFVRTLATSGRFHVDTLLINCGLHDIKTDPVSGAHQVEADAYRANLDAIVVCAKKLADTVAWIETTSVDDVLHARRKCGFGRVQSDIVRYNALAADVMTKHHVAVIELGRFTDTLGSGEDIFRDGVHFVKPVQEQQAAFMAGWLYARFGTSGSRSPVQGRS